MRTTRTLTPTSPSGPAVDRYEAMIVCIEWGVTDGSSAPTTRSGNPPTQSRDWSLDSHRPPQIHRNHRSDPQVTFSKHLGLGSIEGRGWCSEPRVSDTFHSVGEFFCNDADPGISGGADRFLIESGNDSKSVPTSPALRLAHASGRRAVRTRLLIQRAAGRVLKRARNPRSF